MPRISVTWEVSQRAKLPSKEEHSNIYSMVVTLETSQRLISRLNKLYIAEHLTVWIDSFLFYYSYNTRFCDDLVIQISSSPITYAQITLS